MSSNECIVESIIGYKFANVSLIKRALTHCSYIISGGGNASEGDYQRMEFLGDALLDFIVADELFRMYPNYDEGDLSQLRAVIVSKAPLAKVITASGIMKCIYAENNRKPMSDKLKSDVFEALLAAVYLDSCNLDMCRRFVNKFLCENIQNCTAIENTDFKTRLLEYAISKKMSVKFVCDDVVGNAHDLTFYYSLIIDDVVAAKAFAKTKKIAEQLCAKEAYISYGLAKQ